eukprot:1145922-Pelagomonas_calceolata.AAC.8
MRCSIVCKYSEQEEAGKEKDDGKGKTYKRKQLRGGVGPHHGRTCKTELKSTAQLSKKHTAWHQDELPRAAAGTQVSQAVTVEGMGLSPWGLRGKSVGGAEGWAGAMTEVNPEQLHCLHRSEQSSAD